MNRDLARQILGEGATEEQITNLLNNFHNMEKAKNDEIATLKAENSKYSDYDAIKSKLDKIEKANMTEQEKLEQMKKETEMNLKNSRIIVNTAKAKDILVGLDLDDDTIAMLVSDDEAKTINNATKLKEKFDTLKANVEKQTKESLVVADLTPSIPNVNQNENVMTFDKFSTMSAEEQNKWLTENPNGLEKL